jgi:hypothetical protein
LDLPERLDPVVCLDLRGRLDPSVEHLDQPARQDLAMLLDRLVGLHQQADLDQPPPVCLHWQPRVQERPRRSQAAHPELPPESLYCLSSQGD